MTQTVTDYIENIKLAWQVEVAQQLRQAILSAIPEVEERIQYAKPHFLKNGKYAAVFGTAKGWVSFTIFNAQSLETSADLFESSDTGDRKTIKIREGQTVDYAMLERFIAQAASTL